MGYFRKFVLSPATFGAFKFRSKGEKAEIERRKQTKLLEQMREDQIQAAAAELIRQQQQQYQQQPPEYRNYPPPQGNHGARPVSQAQPTPSTNVRPPVGGSGQAKPEYRNYPPPKKPSWWNNYNR